MVTLVLAEVLTSVRVILSYIHSFFVMAEEKTYDEKVEEWSKRAKERKAQQEAWIGDIILVILSFISLGLIYNTAKPSKPSSSSQSPPSPVPRPRAKRSRKKS